MIIHTRKKLWITFIYKNYLSTGSQILSMYNEFIISEVEFYGISPLEIVEKPRLFMNYG